MRALLNFLKSCLEERPGQASTTRLGVMLILAYALLASGAILVMGLIQYAHGHETLANIAATSAGHLTPLAGVAASWKVWQKGKEGSGER